MKRPRPYTADERQNAVTALTGLAAELGRPDAGRTQQLLATLMEEGYSATASGAGPSGGGGGGGDTVLTVVESKAARPDRIALEAQVLALRLQRLRHDAEEALRQLKSLRGDRPVAMCAEGHVLSREGGKRCQYVDPETGRRCGTADVERRCDNCDRLLTPGQKRRKAIAVDRGGVEVSECDRCHAHRRRHGISWGDATRLTPGALGAYSSDDPWIGDHTNA